MPPEDLTATQIEMLGRRWREDPSPHLSLQLTESKTYAQTGTKTVRLTVSNALDPVGDTATPTITVPNRNGPNCP